MAMIELVDASVIFPVRQHAGLTLKEYLTRKIFETRGKELIREVYALRGINLTFHEGSRVGFIGHNGAGKSTLLRAIAGAYPVCSGTREVQGRIASIFDITLGIESEATGRDNMFYRGYLQGETPSSIRDKIDQIAEFSELGQFLDLPIRCYSAGMVMRLAFSIATSVNADILLIDEVFSVGDMAFQEKAQRRMREMIDHARILLVVAHDLNLLRRLCTEVVWLDGGRVRKRGPAAEIIDEYEDFVSTIQARAA